MDHLMINNSRTIPGAELSYIASCAGGPGGQHVNKVATKVTLRFEFETSESLPEYVKEKLRNQASRIDSAGRFFVVCGEHRSQATNLETARERLAEIIRGALVRPKKRRPTKPSRGAKRRRLEAKKRTSEKKRTRGKVDY